MTSPTPATQVDRTSPLKIPSTPTKLSSQFNSQSALFGGPCFDETENHWSTCYECEEDGTIEGDGNTDPFERLREVSPNQSEVPAKALVSSPKLTYDVLKSLSDSDIPGGGISRANQYSGGLFTPRRRL